MQLGVYVVDPTQGTSVQTLIELIKAELELSAAVTELDLRLAEMGYTVRQEHDSVLFTIHDSRFFQVNESFPSLKVSTLPAGISAVTYDVDLLNCGSYRSQYTYPLKFLWRSSWLPTLRDGDYSATCLDLVSRCDRDPIRDNRKRTVKRNFPSECQIRAATVKASESNDSAANDNARFS